MKPSQIWALQRAGIICLNTYLIFSLNFVAIFAQGTPGRIYDDIHSSHKQSYRDNHQNHHSGATSSKSPDSSRQGDNVKLGKVHVPSDDTLRIGTPSSYSFSSRSSGTGKQVTNTRPYKDNKTSKHSGRRHRHRVSERPIKSKLEDTRSISRNINTSNSNKDLLPTKPVSSPLVTRRAGANQHSYLLPPVETGYRDPGDTIDLSKIGGDSSFEIAVDDTKPSRLRVSPEDLLKNSIDRFDAFGDYEYIDVDQHPKKIEFHRPLRKRPPDLRRIDDSIYDPYLWERRRPASQTTVRRVDDGYPKVRFPGSGNRQYGRRRQTKIQPHPNHNYNPQVPLQTSLSRPPYQSHQYFSPNYNPLHHYSGARKPPRRKDTQRFGNGGLRPTQQFQDTISYHDDPLTKLPASYFRPTVSKPPKGIFGSLLKLTGFDDKSTNTDYYHNTNPISARPSGTKGGVLSFLFGSKEDDIQYPDYLDTSYFDPPYGQPGYTDYDYGDYNEGVGLYPPKKLTVPERVAKWFSGFKIPSSKRRRFGGPRRPGERITFGGGHSPYPLDYDYYDTADDHNLIFYGQHNHIGQRPPSFGGGGHGSDDFDITDVTDAIKNNGTGVDIATKVLSLLAKHTERADSNSMFMMWTIPTTILALMGIVYFVGALAIVSYKYSLFFNGDSNQAVNLIPIIIAFSLPLIFGIILVSGRASLSGQLDVSRVMKGDFSSSMRSDFDGVDFTMDGMFGSFGLLGLAWLASVTI